MKTKAVQLLINSSLPEELQDFNRPVSAKGLGQMFHQVALKAPDQYARILKEVGDAGRNAAYWQGESMGLDDLRDVIDVPSYLKGMDAELAEKTKGLKDPTEKRRVTEDIWNRWSARIEQDSMKAALSKQNAVGLSVASGARGKPLQLKAMLSTPGTFEDSKGKVVPLFARRSYARGVSPGEWLAGTYGARTSVTSTKRATAKGGFVGKQLAQTAANLMVTQPDCGTKNGIDLDASDPQLRGRFLAQPAGGLDANMLLDRRTMAKLQNSGWKKSVLVRSPLTCESKHGICARCLGADPSGHLFPVGYAAGITAANAVGEPLAQAALNCLAEGTLVLMADETARPVQDVQVGEWVMGCDMNGHRLPVQVKAVWDQGVQVIQRLVFEDATYLDCTACHRILGQDASGQVTRVPAEELEVAYTLEGPRRVAGRDDRPDQQCWDLSVDHPHELFCLANGLVVKNTKHTSGAASAKKSYSGLDWLIRFIQIPDNFPDRAPVAEQAGNVTVKPAPQGGHHVYVGNTEHYVPQALELKVKNGDTVEAGEPLSEGIVRPDDIVRLRGLGEGRRYYANRFREMLEDSGVKLDPRHHEVLARGAVNHVQVLNSDDDSVLPDDVVPFNLYWQNREEAQDTKSTDTNTAAVGKYLQSPALHYTPGTKLTHKMVTRLNQAGIKAVPVSEKAPDFAPTMVRMQTQSFAQPDWLAAMSTSYLGRQLSQRAARGDDTNIRDNINYVPRLAVGEGFGKHIERTGTF